VSYSVVKHGIIGLTRYTATYWANKNIRCNAIAPGGIINNQSKSFLKKISQLIPLGRLAYKNEYEASILYLISDASSYMNGAVLTIDGGRTAL
jgi:NAD(P)-dependent dehydrogenase (short-subunit alcohol dehydrogenase family)